MYLVKIGRHAVVASEVLASYWHVAGERQRVYHSRLRDEPPPWTDDPVISRYRFTNAYRAADRVSQELIQIIYAGSQEPEDLVLRILLFRLFNKPSTWRALVAEHGEVSAASFSVERFSATLDRLLARGERIYSAAYIIPPPPFGAVRKHRNHLLLIEHMLRDGVTRRIESSKKLNEVFDVLTSYPSLGPFLAYQLTIDLNYSNLVDFDENDFVVPGPGAQSGIRKCFPNATNIASSEIIRWMVDTQNEQFSRYGVHFENLFGRDLTLIDCQNLFCETDKYARIVHPGVLGIGNRTRIKQQFVPLGTPSAPFFPPKWGISSNQRIPDGSVAVSA